MIVHTGLFRDLYNKELSIMHVNKVGVSIDLGIIYHQHLKEALLCYLGFPYPVVCYMFLFM